MEAGNFKRYVWNQGERKRQGNRQKYEEKKKKYEDNYVEEPEPAKPTEYLWPGEFEDQLRKRNAKLEAQDSLDDELPSSNSSMTSEMKNREDEDEIANVNNEDSRQNGDDVGHGKNNGRGKPRGNEHKDKAADNKLRTQSIFPNYTIYSDEFLEPPKPLPSATSGNPFFLVSSNLVNK